MLEVNRNFFLKTSISITDEVKIEIQVLSRPSPPWLVTVCVHAEAAVLEM